LNSRAKTFDFMADHSLLEKEQLLNLLETAVAQAKEAVLITSALLIVTIPRSFASKLL
jgi:hypothetical protein